MCARRNWDSDGTTLAVLSPKDSIVFTELGDTFHLPRKSARCVKGQESREGYRREEAEGLVNDT